MKFRKIFLILALMFAPIIAVAATKPADIAKQDAAARPKLLRVGIVGDVMAQGLSQAIKRQQEKIQIPKIEYRNFAKGSSGFVRDDYYDWNKVLPGILSLNKLDYMLVFMGSNDRQSIRHKGKNYKAKTPKWREEYIHRIDEFLDKLKDKGVKIIWLGQPISRGKSFSADMALFNEIYRQHVETHDGVFFDVWSLFANENGKYSASGPDVAGQIKKLRAGNGIHFTRRGYDKLAFQIMELIESQENGEGVLNNAVDVGEAVDFEKYDLSEQAANDTIIVERKKDAPAKVVKLADSTGVFGNDDDKSPDDEATGADQAKELPEENLPLWKKVLEKGFVIDAEFGRGDDFSWPRN